MTTDGSTVEQTLIPWEIVMSMNVANTAESGNRPQLVTGREATELVRSWLRKGYEDFQAKRGIALAYGVAFAVLSWLVMAFLWLTGLEWMLLPAISGALLVGPIIAVGLYQMSRKRQGDTGQIAAPGQIALVGGVLMVLFMVWIRAATILFALFFGLKPFPGFIETLSTIFLSVEGIALLVVGTLVGGLFASLTFAISAYSLPMLVDREVDAFTAMGRSFSVSANQIGVTLRWSFVVTVLAIFGLVTGMIGMIVVFPILGFATWHAYRDMMPA